MADPASFPSTSRIPSVTDSRYSVSEKYRNRDFSEYILLSPAPGTSEWQHNLMKFAVKGNQQISVDPKTFSKPVKLNRRDERYIRHGPPETPVEPVKAENDDVEMLDAANGKEKRDESLIAPRSGKDVRQVQPDGTTQRRAFQKKTNQVFQTEASRADRRLQATERFPWLLEDQQASRGLNKRSTQRWAGRLEAGYAGGVLDGASGGTSISAANLVLFMLDSSAKSMTVTASEKSYQFKAAPLGAVADGDEAETEFNQRAKGKIAARWATRNRVVEQNSTKQEEAKVEGMLNSRGRSGPKIKREPSTFTGRRDRAFNAVHSERASVRNDEDDEEGGRGRQRDQHDIDEFDYDDDVQDDEEGAGTYGDDVLDQEDVKALERRMKQDMQGGNHLQGDQQPAQEDTNGNLFSDDDDAAYKLDREGKATKKALNKLRKRDGSDDDSSDDDGGRKRNPYARSDEESDSDSTSSSTKKDSKITSRPHSPPQLSESGRSTPVLSQSSKATSNAKSKPRPPSVPQSRAASPVPSPASALLVRRATSPKRANGSRAVSPIAASSRGASPLADGPSPGIKRKSEALQEGSEKKTKVAMASPANLSAVLNRDAIVAFLAAIEQPEDATPKKLLGWLKKKGVNPRMEGVMSLLTELLRETCDNVNGILTLKS